MEAERLARLIDRHGAALVLYARQWCAAPEDVVQEAFVKLARQGTAPDNPSAWLYRVVRNGAISAGRSEQRRRKHEQVASEMRGNWFHQETGSEIDTEEATAVLQGLPLPLREVIVAHIWGGLTFEQIAGVAGCSASTAHRRYVEGLSRIRERLESKCPIDT